MERESHKSKENYWRAQMSMAEGYGGSLASFCRAQGLSLNTFNYWKKKFAAESARKALVPSPFVSVSVEPLPAVRGLPDPRWVAELILHLSGGAR